MKKYYVYAFLDSSRVGEYVYFDIKFQNEPFYIGKGTGNRINESLHDKSAYKANKIKHLKDNGINIIQIIICDNLSNFEALELEKKLISEIGRKDLGLGPLVNLTNGGDGRLFSNHSEETKNKISQTKKLQNLKIKHSDFTKQKLSNINSGEKNPFWNHTHSEQVKELQSERVIGINHPMWDKKHSIETIIKIKKNRKIDQEYLNNISRINNCKSVLQFDKSGHLISEYESIKIAAAKTGLSESLIGKCCRGVIKNPSKFIFKFKNEESKLLKNSFKIKIGQNIHIEDTDYLLVSRTKVSFTAQNEEGKLFSFRRSDYEFIWDKNVI